MKTAPRANKVTGFFIMFILFTFVNSYAQANSKDSLLYSFSLEDLMELNLIPDTNSITLAPSYDIAIADLMQLQIIKAVEIDEYLNITYDMKIEDLQLIEIVLLKNKERMEPSYEMSLEGILEIEIVNEVNVKETVSLTYELSLEGLLKLQLSNP